MTGLLKGMRDAGTDLTGADVIVGTSAGSVVGAVIANGLLDASYERQIGPVDPAVERAAVLDLSKFATALGGGGAFQMPSVLSARAADLGAARRQVPRPPLERPQLRAILPPAG